ncbi:MAG: choice-of-anchor tandem repeat GloVer-containing protein [Bryobacteraceae bacterium]
MRIGRNGGWFPWLLSVAMAMAPAKAATETVIHTFGSFPIGANPYGNLAEDPAGNLYGTAYQGGTVSLGTVFKLGKPGYKLLHSFTGGTDGATPYAGVALDSAGNLYGTTFGGGASGKGVVYKVSASGQETVLYAFTGGADGGSPYAGVVLDAAGNLYGTAYYGGTANAGVVYKVSPAGQETVLYSFTGGTDGANPYDGVTFDSSGNLYGTTYAGGATSVGVVYMLTASGQEIVLHNFEPFFGEGPTDGALNAKTPDGSVRGGPLEK